MERLISMTDFVLEQDITDVKQRNSIVNYANFLKQPLNLSMFVPCKLVDGVWVVLEEPIAEKLFHHTRKVDYGNDLKEYQEAKDRFLFEGFELNQKDLSKLENIICITKNKIQVTFFKRANSIFLDNLTTNKIYEVKTIEDLVKYNLELTPTAKKQIGL